MKKSIRILTLVLLLILNLNIVNIYADTVYDKESVKSIQSILNMWGYNCGTPDGILGQSTSEAIRKYQKDQGISETGEISTELLDTMLVGIPLTTLNERYNEAVTYWNKLNDDIGISKLNYSNFSRDELNYCLNDNMEIFLLISPNNNMIKWATISSDASFDTATSLIEIYTLVYAFDVNIKSPEKVQDLVGNILDASSYDEGGIHFANTSQKGKGLKVYMKYDTD